MGGVCLLRTCGYAGCGREDYYTNSVGGLLQMLLRQRLMVEMIDTNSVGLLLVINCNGVVLGKTTDDDARDDDARDD